MCCCKHNRNESTSLISVLRCVAVCGSVLQCEAVCCSVLRCVALFCKASQYASVGIVRRNALCCRRTTSKSISLESSAGAQWFPAMCCSVLQCVAVRCSVLQCVAMRCSVLQCAAACCSNTRVAARCRHTRNESTSLESSGRARRVPIRPAHESC